MDDLPQSALAAGVAALLTTAPASARELKIVVDSFKHGGTIPHKYAFCMPAEQGHTTGGPNISPGISWSKGPRATKSDAIILYDTDTPAEQREKMNKEGMTLTADTRRQTFYHWILADIPPNVTSVKEGADSDAHVLHGKPALHSLCAERGLAWSSHRLRRLTALEAMRGKIRAQGEVLDLYTQNPAKGPRLPT